MAQVIANLKYTKEHEWALIEGDTAIIGITDFAQGALGDIVFVELPEAGRVLKQGEAFGVVESIKSVSDLYSPISGEIVDANGDLPSQPELLNTAPYANWMIKIKISNPSEVNSLLSAKAYEDFCASQH